MPRYEVVKMSVKEILAEAIETGEVITIIYNGGSQPGTKRPISPIKISDSKVRARCLISGIAKIFFLKKIQIVSNPDMFNSYDVNLKNT